MSPAVFVDAAAAWALAPGFNRTRDGRWPAAVAREQDPAAEDEHGGRA